VLRPKNLSLPLIVVILAVGLALGGLLIGYEPVGGDPDTMYRPIKSELARSLRAGTLPFWSDRFGLGVPLVAESHAGAFYPLNWGFYRFPNVNTAYRLLMWLHFVALAVTTYAYAKSLNLTRWSSALAALAFTFCGFQTSHSAHEPFYTALPYLPLALLLAERYVSAGRLLWLALLALCWGTQLTLGHFQIPMWTGGLVLLVGWWRVVADRRPWPRAFGLPIALAWGAAIGAVQLALTWELRTVAGFDRPTKFLLNYSFPPAHWAQLAFPRLFMRLSGGPEGPYWGRQHTTEAEACLYIGTLPFVFACVGLVAARRHRELAPWRWIALIGFVLATMPRWFPEGYELVLELPGVGLFRAPGRYTLLTAFGLSLWAGRGFDRWLPRRATWGGVAVAVAFGASAAGWAWWWADQSGLGKALGESAVSWRLLEAGAAWTVMLSVFSVWRRKWVGCWAPFLAAAIELAMLFYAGPTEWGWSVALPDQSPVLLKLAREPAVGLVAGRLENIPVRAGLVPAFPYLGITPPPPNYLLEETRSPEKSATLKGQRWMRRFGVTHGVWEASVSAHLGETLFVGPDSALDRVVPRGHNAQAMRTWRIVAYQGAFPHAHVAVKSNIAENWGDLYSRLSQSDCADEVWYERPDAPPDSGSPRARSARVANWDGRSGSVEHDGVCELVIRRTHYPGWTARINGGPALPLHKADGGLQAVRLEGAGVSRIELAYEPTEWSRALGVSLAAIFGVVVVLMWACWNRLRARRARCIE
jgi:hypothetical protein